MEANGVDSIPIGDVSSESLSVIEVKKGGALLHLRSYACSRTGHRSLWNDFGDYNTR